MKMELYCQENMLQCMERFHLSHILPMQYKSIISAISKYMSFLSIDRSSLNRDCSLFMTYYFESILLKDKITMFK